MKMKCLLTLLLLFQLSILYGQDTGIYFDYKKLKNHSYYNLLRSENANKVWKSSDQLYKPDSIILRVDDSPLVKYEYIFNDDFNQVQFIEIALDIEMNQWYNNYRDIIDYDENKNVIQTQSEFFNLSLKEWEPFKKEVRKYLENKKTQTLRYDYDENIQQWENEDKIEYFYNNFSKLDIELISSWNDSDSSWFFDIKKEYIYDSNNNISEMITYYNSEYDSSEWKIRSKYFYNTNSDGYISKGIRCSYNQDDYKWDSISFYQYTYDNYKNISSFEWYLWCDSCDSWAPIDMESYSYDTSILLKNVLAPFYVSSDGNQNNIVNTIKVYDMDKNIDDWSMLGEYQFFYSMLGIPQSNRNLIVQKINIYPNPFKNEILLNGLDNYNSVILELYNIHGQKIIDKNITGQNLINLEKLKPGLYFYNIIYDNKKLSGKLIKN